MTIRQIYVMLKNYRSYKFAYKATGNKHYLKEVIRMKEEFLTPLREYCWGIQ